MMRDTKQGNMILFAGLAGGLAELLWVALYCSMAPLSGGEVARQITASLFPVWAQATYSVPLGMAIHFALSVLLASVFARAVWQPFLRQRGAVATLLGGVAALAAVWAVNFLAVLPLLNPAFVALMPYAVTLGSKLLFGGAMAAVLNGAGRASGINSMQARYATWARRWLGA